MNLADIIHSLIEENGVTILSSNRILNILNDLGYYKEYPNQKLIFRILVEKNILHKLTDVSVSEETKKQMFNDFIYTTGFDLELGASIFSSVSGLSYSVFDDRIHWSPSLSKKEMDKYILQHLKYYFDKQIIIKDINSQVISDREFYIWFEFDEESLMRFYDYIKKRNDEFIKLGELNRVKSDNVSIDIWTRSGNDIFASENYGSNKVDFEWEQVMKDVGDEYGWTQEFTGLLSLGIRVDHPLFDLSWIQIRL